MSPPQQLLTSLQEQADKNGAYILLVDGAGDIVRQLVPQQPETLSPITVASGTLPKGITAAVKGVFKTTDGKIFLYAAYPLTRQSLPLTSVDTLVLATVRPGIMTVVGTFIWPLLLAAVFALIVSLIIAIFLARAIYRPLARLPKPPSRYPRGTTVKE